MSGLTNINFVSSYFFSLASLKRGCVFFPPKSLEWNEQNERQFENELRAVESLHLYSADKLMSVDFEETVIQFLL